MNNQLVSSSSFSSTPSWKYDVFLSFRGEDTRSNFTDHLYKALDDKGINTFIDRQLRRGEEISSALLEAVEESRISIIIFSKNYASSRWCLDELVHILACRKSRQQEVWPVFYKVDPSHVRNQTNTFGEAFTKLKCSFEDNKEKIHAWRSALRDAANLSGHTVKEGEYEATFIDKIVTEILVKVIQRTYLNVAKYPVGIQSCVQEVKELLGVEGNDPCVVGIWGTSGIGKTTIAKAVHCAIAHKFEGSCFLADVSERSTSCEGVIQLQKTLLSKVLCGTELKFDDAHQGISLIKKLLRRKKILLLLDDVDELEQLNNLVGVDWFGEGSRVIITTKDRGLLESYGVGLIYKVQKLKDGKALKLFSLNAFGRNEPPHNYLELAQHAIAYAEGLPLALNLIGSHLRNKNIDRWQAILDNYDSYDGEPYRGIQKILRKSYDTLGYALQQVFLDIACFFKGEKKGYVLQILRNSKLRVPSDCIEVLVEKAIITIENNTILMHDLLEKMGKRIVSEESPIEPGKRSRLWNHQDVYHVLTENRGTEKIKGIVVKWPKPDVIPLNSKSFFEMVNLEIFISHNASFSGCVDYLPNDLRWIDLDGDIWGSKHTLTFNLQYFPRHLLVTFNMSYSDNKQLKEFKVQKLKDGKALELLSLNAFGRNEPPDNYLELAQRAIAYAEGRPLALNFISSCLRNKSIDRWQAILDSYDSYDGEPCRGIQKILRKTYDTLDYALQQVFLDIACFFKGEKKDYVLQILRSSKLHVPSDCMEVLVEKAIITIEDNTILMHDLLEKMGKRIVSEESPNEPGKRSRLWHHEDVYRVLTENIGTKKIRGIVVNWPKPNVIPLNSKSFFKMVNLEIFISRNARFSGCVDYLPNDLRWIDLGSNIFLKHTVLVYSLLRKEDEWLPLSSDTVHEEYDRQRQWLFLSSKPADDHPKRRQIDLNVPFDIEKEEEEQPSTSYGSQFFLH